MRKKPIVAGVVLIVVLLLLGSIVFIPAHPSSPTITVRHIKSVQSSNGVTATFEITNHTARSYFVYPISVEVSNGLVWKKCFDFSSFPGPILDPNGCESMAFDMTNLPTGTPLRLRMCAGTELRGLERFFRRLDLRFRQGQGNVPLNPFDKGLRAFAKSTEIVSDEFVETEPNQSGQGNSAQ